MTIEQIIENNFKKLNWDSLMEAYYNLELVPFMNVIYDSAKEYAKLNCEKQKEICADNAALDTQTHGELPSYWFDVTLNKESILNCINAADL